MKLISFFVLLCALTTSCNTQNQPVVPPEMISDNEWFLATGDWQQDPRLFVKTLGNGTDTVIMLHGGWGGEHSGLINATNGLENDYFFVFYDQRGSLRSPFPDSLITFDHHIEDLELLRKELGLDKLKIVGHSMGAVLAGAYHHKYPKKVKKLVLLAPAWLINPVPVEDQPLVASHQNKLNQFLQRQEVKDELINLNLNRDPHELSSREATKKFRVAIGSRFLFDISNWTKLRGGGPFYNPNVGYLTNQTMPANGWNYISDFERSGVSVSVIIGDHDFLDMGANIIKKWTENSADVDIGIIKDAGHSIWLDKPVEFQIKLVDALRE